jgi:hypothetical protein
MYTVFQLSLAVPHVDAQYYVLQTWRKESDAEIHHEWCEIRPSRRWNVDKSSTTHVPHIGAGLTYIDVGLDVVMW